MYWDGWVRIRILRFGMEYLLMCIIYWEWYKYMKWIELMSEKNNNWKNGRINR
jgi:hypothetical protein